MDISVGGATGLDIPKNSGSLDLWSVSVKKSRSSDRKPRSGKRIFSVNQAAELTKAENRFSCEKTGSNLAESGRKRIRSEVPLSSFGLSGKKGYNGFNDSRPEQNESIGRSLGSSNINLQHLGIDHEPLLGKADHDCLHSHFNSENRNSLGGNIIIPKRPRIASKQKGTTDSLCLDTETSISDHEKSGNGDINKPSSKNLPLFQVLNDEQAELNELNLTNNDIPIPSTSREDRSYISASDVKDGSKTNGGRSGLVEDQPVIHDSEDSIDKFQEGDENLEENAARMLSSRFNPSCTEFSGKGNTYVSNGVNVSRLRSNHGTLKGSKAGSSLVDPASRNLRPRRKNGKNVARKRRHFYEVRSKDVDPYFIVKQKIRVFWPLDKNWYFGIVKGYDPVSKLHHIKYDDRDEEWINLQNERFKLLLFPSEISGKFGIKETINDGNVEDIDDSCVDSMLESEPIISWLSRTIHRPKAGSSSVTRKQRRVIRTEGIKPSILLESQGNISPSPSDGSKLLLKGDMAELSFNEDMSKFPDSKRRIGSNLGKLPYVYFRRRFRTRQEALDRKPEQDANQKSSLCSISTVSKVADALTNEVELNMPILGLNTLTMIFSLTFHFIKKIAFGIGICWPYYAISILQSNGLSCVWPIVHMGICFLDNNSGLKLLLFEGCLRRAISIFCLIISTFDHCDMNANTKEEITLASIRFKISDPCYKRRSLIVFSSFSDIKNSKWAYIEALLKRSCRKGEVAVADCMCSNVIDIAGAQHQRLYKGSLGVSCSHVVCDSTPYELSDSYPNSFVYYVGEKCIKSHPCLFSFPSLLFSSPNPPLKLLIEKTAASLCLEKSTYGSLQDYPDNTDSLTDNGCFEGNSLDHVPEVRLERQASLGEAAGIFEETKADVLLPCTIVDSSRDMGIIMKKETLIENETSCLTRSLQVADELSSLCNERSSSAGKTFYAIGESSCNTANGHIQVLDQVEGRSNDKRESTADHATNLVMEMKAQSFHGPTARRNMWRRSRNTPLSQTFNHCPKLWAEDFMPNDLSCGYKKPRSQVSYSAFSSNYELDTKSQCNYQKSQPNKKIKSDKVNKLVDCAVPSQSYLETLACDANILVSDGTKGWRECGAQVVLHSDDQKNWMMFVKLSGTTKYVYKANQNLQPGSTNRFNHAMMWKGGKDWTLEFTDRSQWSLFKQMHEECYNRNMRAASIKSIPIPGVRLIADVGARTDYHVPFIHSSSKYFHYVGTEIDFALDPSHVLYEMDSEDEEWISKLKHSLVPKGDRIQNITEEMFERAMDMLEKLAYRQQSHEFTNDEMDEFMADVGPSGIVEAIHEHWMQKRLKKGLPLIRQFQPPLWEHYQKQLKEWESIISKMPSQPEGGQDKLCFNKKPPMFAFCLRPRGLEVPNKGSKHRSHKKLALSGHHNKLPREQDYFSSFGRKSDGITVGDEKVIFASPGYESSESVHGLQSLSSFSTRDTASTESLSGSEGSDRYPDPKPYRSRPIKIGNFHSTKDFHMTHFPFNQGTKRNGAEKWNSEYLEWPSQKQQSVGFRRPQSDINEFALRDASSAAQHALNMAKLKREKANWLLHKADLAVHRATVALMTAEAIKASEKDNTGDG